MMTCLKYLLLVVATANLAFLAQAQEKPSSNKQLSAHVLENDLAKYASEASKWDKDVAKLADNNSIDGGDEAILCLGSSSFRLWDTISTDLAPYKIVRRAYGGAKYCDLAIHAPQLIDSLRFRAAMIFVANDITDKENKTPEEIARLSKLVIESIRKRKPDAPIFLIAITPSPSRFKHWPKIVLANQALERLAKETPNAFFIATHEKYLNAQGEPRSELFVKDMLHQNQDGYAIWSAILKDSLGKHLR